jgi:hypothetical protein
VPRLTRRTFLGPILIALLAACSGDSERRRAAETRDSAGVAVVENRGSSTSTTFSFSPEPLVDISAAGSEPLVQVVGAVRLRDRIVVADLGASRLSFHDLDGKLVRATGHRGRGPGEFQLVTWVGALGPDSVAAWDAGLKRFTVFSATGEAARTMAPAGTLGFFPTIYGAFDDGTLLMTSGTGAGEGRGGPWRDTTTFLRVGRTGQVLGSLGRFPGPEQVRGSGAARTYARPFGRETVVAVHGSGFSVSTGDGYEVATIGADGTPRRIIRRDAPAVRLSNREIADYRAEVLASVPAADAPAWRRMLDDAPFPDRLPPVTGLVAGPAGELWVREAQPPATLDEGARWSVFGPDGRWLGSTTAPPGFALLQVGPDWVLGRFTDADQSDRVRVHRLTRSTSASGG